MAKRVTYGEEARPAILKGVNNRRPSIALSILTGRVAEQLSILESFFPTDPVVVEDAPALQDDLNARRRPLLRPRTVYLSEADIRDIDSIIEALSREQLEPKRITRSAVLRQALEQLHVTIQNKPTTSTPPRENE